MRKKKLFILLVFLFCYFFSPSMGRATITESNDITVSTTWTNADVHLVTADISVTNGATLTISPGTIVKFESERSLSVTNGNLWAVGESGNKIVFTSYRDDSHGGDTNGDGPSTGSPGDWNRIYFQNSSSSRVEHVVIRYGGHGGNGSIYMHQSDVPVISSEITESGSHGIRTDYSSPQIQGNTISNNSGRGIYHYGSGSPTDQNNTIAGNDYGIYVQSATPTITGNTITGNTHYGIYFQYATNTPEITNNTIRDNEKPVRLPFSAVPGQSAGNTLAPNTKNQIEFLGNTLDRDLTLPATPVAVYYQVSGDVTVAADKTLTLSPGVIWKLSPNRALNIYGNLQATGTEDNKIVFTSYRDDTHGGDTNGDGASSGSPGDWNYIYFNNSSSYSLW